MNYKDISSLNINSIVKFKEYIIGRHEERILSKEITGKLLFIVEPQIGLNNEEISQFYPGISEEYYYVLSTCPFYRLVLNVGVNPQNTEVIETVEMNELYMTMNLQELEVIQESLFEFKPETPGQLLGFNAYAVGNKFGNDT